MSNVSHASLTGAELHEPKGVAVAGLGEVYVADGAGSGNWANVGTSSFTGMIADFTWPVVQAGWLELDGTDINTTTFAALYAVMTIQQSGTRTNGSAIITSLSSTFNIRAGYYVFGSGIASGTTVLSIDSPNQITLSATASSSGNGIVAVSPWLLNAGTIRLPNLSAAGRYRRSRTASTAVGQLQADQNKAHTHAVTGDTGSVSSDHTHNFSGTTTTESVAHTHALGASQNAFIVSVNNGGGASQGNLVNTSASVSAGLTTGSESALHTHSYSGTTTGISANHSHPFSATSASDGGSETRPLSIVVMTCVKI